MKENIKCLEKLNKSLENSINELKKIIEKKNEEKEKIKLEVQNIFTKIRNALNEKEDELLIQIDKEYDNLFCRTKITDQLYCRYAYVSESGDVTLYFTDCDFNVYIPFQYYGDLDNTSDIWDTADRFVGKSFNLEGTFCYRITSTGKIQYQIVPSSSNDITVVENPHGTLPNDRLTATEISTIASGLNPSSNEKTAMTYFFTGIIDELDAENSSVENLYATMTIKDGSSSVKLFKLAIPSKFVENYYNSTFVQDFTYFLDAYLLWLEEMAANNRHLDLFKLNSKDKPFNLINGIEPKADSFYKLKRNFEEKSKVFDIILDDEFYSNSQKLHYIKQDRFGRNKVNYKALSNKILISNLIKQMKIIYLRDPTLNMLRGNQPKKIEDLQKDISIYDEGKEIYNQENNILSFTKLNKKWLILPGFIKTKFKRKTNMKFGEISDNYFGIPV